VTEEQRRTAYAAAFLTQAQSDWQVFRMLAGSPASRCHSLHYLQMACEKLAKAYRLRDTASPVDEIVSRHTGFEKFVGAFLLAIKHEYAGRDAQLTLLIRRSRGYAREIEKLAPATDRLAAPENAEYPWEANGVVVAPCDYPFPSLAFLREPGGLAFLNLVQRALDQHALLALS
jgi:hypothetical protein